MARTFFFIYLALLTPHLAHTQDYIVNGAEWYYELKRFSGPEQIHRCYIDGDSIIQDRVCQRFIQEKPGCEGRPAVNYLYKENQQVFIYDQDDSTFHLLYDWGLKAGDTMIYETGIHSWDQRRRTIYLAIESVSKTPINGDSLNVFTYQVGLDIEGDISFYNPGEVIIEGIGNTLNFFHLSDGTGFCDNQYSYPLLCFASPEFSLYGFTERSCETVNTFDQQKEISALKIYPNPIHEVLNISSPKVVQDGSIRITTLQGQIVLKKAWQSSSKIQTLILNTLPPGIYLIEVHDTSNRYPPRKIIKVQ